jgi:hypothetical protein
MIPRVKRLLHRAVHDARSGPVTPARILLELLEGREPACERLGTLGVDVEQLTAATRRMVVGAEDRRAG